MKKSKILAVILAVCFIGSIAAVRIINDAHQKEIKKELVAETFYDGQGVPLQDLADEYIETFDQIGDADQSSIQIYEGTYTVGTDIPAGIYKLTCTENSGAYWELCNNSSRESDDITASEVFYSTTYVYVNDGEYFTITGCKGTLLGL